MNAGCELMSVSIILNALAGTMRGRARMLLGVMSLLAFDQAILAFKQVGIVFTVLDEEKV